MWSLGYTYSRSDLWYILFNYTLFKSHKMKQKICKKKDIACAASHYSRVGNVTDSLKKEPVHP